jgi:hypothetical protein
MAMDSNSRKELFSYAYVKAVAAVAGYSVQEKTRAMDYAGQDLTIELPGELAGTLFPRFDAQVKCTSSPDVIKENSINFPLPVNNYDKLRNSDVLVPHILIVVLVPEEFRDWMSVSEEQIVLKKCGYWVSLKGMPATQNRNTVTVALPRTNLLTPDNLTQIMEKIAKGEEL